MLRIEGRTSDGTGAALLLDALTPAKTIFGDRGYNADWFRNAPIAKATVRCSRSRANRKIPVPHDRAFYRQRQPIENMFGKRMDWRRIRTRYDQCAPTFFSVIAIAATVIFWR